MEYRICTRTVMDTSDPDIRFNEVGECQYVEQYRKALNELVPAVHQRESEFKKLVSQLTSEGRGKSYDCVVGLSGGADSTYVAWLVKNAGLRPLAVHVDNGWNSELAVSNIEHTVKQLGIDLVTYVIDWEEFRDLQIAYLRASVVDIEALTDNAILVAINRIAREQGIRSFVSGTNIATEFVMPRTWFYDVKYDSLNIRAIHKRFGEIRKLSSYPLFSFTEYVRYRYRKKRATTYSILNYVDYNKEKVIPLIQRELGWRDYGGKHCESRFTSFYQRYILPVKFGIDKRRAFLSTLILSGQLTRDEALAELARPLYGEAELEDDLRFVTKKLRLKRSEFDEIMKASPVPHEHYPGWQAYHEKLRAFVHKKIRG